MQTFNLPKYSRVLYLYNPSDKHYHQTVIEAQEGPLKRLPIQMRIAPVGASQIKPNADKMLLSREHMGNRYAFRTGLQETNFLGWHLGNDFEFKGGRKVISLILCHLAKEGKELTLYYFHHYDKPNNWHRMVFAHAAIPHLLKTCIA